ncbi:hypothetical protein G9P44_005357 [Scheffersomyces stipitis]|nr:hypothetical protein G9P44_005357 [Scheffersomyces stipitis]
MDSQYLASLEETLRNTLVPDSAPLPALFQILQTAQDDKLKQLAAVEARKLVLTNWANVDASLKPAIRDNLLNNTFKQPSKLIRHSSARVVAAIGELDLESNEWQDLLPTLVSGVQNADVQTKEMAVYTLYTILETQIPALVAHVGEFLTLFSNLLSDQSSRDVRVNSVLSLDVLSQFLEEDAQVDAASAAKFRDSIPGMVEVLKEVLAADDSEKAKDIFNVFNSLIYLDSKLVGDHLVSLIQFVAGIASNTDLDEEYRTFALQFLISCVSMRKSKISSNKLGPQLTLVAVKIACEEIDVEAELENDDEENENEENSPSSLGLRLVAMLSAELAPSQVITHCLKLYPPVVGGLKDSEILVRVAALRTLSNLTSELQDIVAEYHEELLPLIIDIIETATYVIAYKYACYALDGLIEFMSHDSMGTYIEPLMNKLFQMLQQANSSKLKSAVVSAIGSTAFASGKAFIPYFNTSIQYFEPFLANAAETDGMTEDDIELRAQTFENISTMARAVGTQSFSSYAKPLVEAAYGSLSSEHSRIRESGFAFISNMAKVYGPEFAGFLDQIVPQILKCLEQDEFTFNVDEVDEEDDDVGNALKVHTGITIEKEIASVALSELAIGTGKEFAKYVEASFKTLSDQIENSYGMREAAMSALFKITKAMFTAAHGASFKAPKGVPQAAYIDPSVLQLVQQLREIAIPLLEEEFELSMVACILMVLSMPSMSWVPTPS